MVKRRKSNYVDEIEPEPKREMVRIIRHKEDLLLLGLILACMYCSFFCGQYFGQYFATKEMFTVYTGQLVDIADHILEPTEEDCKMFVAKCQHYDVFVDWWELNDTTTD